MKRIVLLFGFFFLASNILAQFDKTMSTETVYQVGIKNIYNQLRELLISSRKKKIDITHLKAGIYLLQSEEQTQKFIKQ